MNSEVYNTVAKILCKRRKRAEEKKDFAEKMHVTIIINELTQAFLEGDPDFNEQEFQFKAFGYD